MNKLQFGVIASLLFIIVLSLSSYAVPPVTQVGGQTTNLIIEYPPLQYFEVNKNISLHFHVYNATGHPLTNATTSCYFHLYNQYGSHIIKGNEPVPFDTTSSFDWEYKIREENNTRLGEYTYIIQCNNTIAGGFVANSFLTVMDQNKYLYGDVGSQNYDLALILGLLGIAFFLVYISDKFKIEGESFIKAITALGISLIFKLSAFAVIIYDLLLLREVIPGAVTSYTTLYDPMLQLLMYGVGGLFFLLYFINSIATLAYNFNLQKMNKTQERKYG